MPTAAEHHTSTVAPKQPKKHHSYNEDVDEPATLIDNEPVEIEREAPAEENDSVERTDESGKPDAPAFEE
jgi:hypothetical protein